MNADSLLDLLITVVVYSALATVAGVALYAGYSFIKALVSLKDRGLRHRVIGI
ncbi:hypothetical protein [Endothiovibrio diazotrophicus]